ncbi:TolC family protein [Candidatus Sulfidibacterium hydrothermale]|uniref:TolC family protein n=1 Tax=Candidatus Sulfidibacterium hydrothermale TaxID=2875962 RepID=UPI001F0B628A|nr:TolC family protein [Candidatus Sulfidibacterium hydrothermale]UBM62503.1 TolC family protein [Candidatus Sulfidibacterium hydrothermale]
MFKSVHKLKILLSFIFITTVSTPLFAQVWTLQQCIDTAQQYNTTLQISKNDMAVSTEKEKEAKANLIPKLKFSADYKYFIDQPYQLMPQSAFGGPEGLFKEVQFGTPHNFNIGVQAALPLYNSQIYGAIKATKTASKLKRLQFKKTREEVFFNVSNLYYNAQILKHQLAFVDSNLVNTTKLLATMKLLHEQQLAKNTDVENVQLQEAKLKVQREIVLNNLNQVIRLLKFTMGIPSNQPFDVETEIHYQANTTYTPHVIVDIQLAETQKSLLSNELKTLKNSRIPSVSLYGAYSQVGFGYDKKPNDFLKFYPTTFAGLQITVPLFNGTVTKRKINQKKIELKNSQLRLNLLNEQNNIEIKNARNQRAVALKNILNTSAQIKLAESVYRHTVLQQKQGLANITDVLMADSNLKEAQQNYIAAVVNYLKADLELKKLTGNIDSTVK